MSNIPFIDIEGGGGGSDFQISGPPIATPNFGILSLGGGPFDGVTTGHFSGVSTGTVIGINLPSGSTADPLNIQTAGVSSFKISRTSPLALLVSPAAATVPLVVKAAASQTADLQQWQSSTGSVLAAVQQNGWIMSSQGFAEPSSVGPYIQTGTTDFTHNARSSTQTPIIIKGAASQSADLQQWQSSAGHVQLGVANAGTGVTPVWALRIRALANAESMGQTHTLGVYSGKSIQVLDDAGATVGWIPLYA